VHLGSSHSRASAKQPKSCGVGAGRHPGGARGGADVAGGGLMRAGVAEALGDSGAALVALFGVSA
jgi:hypothetical protein